MSTPPSQIRRYQEWLSKTRGLRFTDYAQMWRWSVSDLDAFWRSIWDYHGVASSTPFESVLSVERMPGAVWFKGAHVNYARHVFQHLAAAEDASQSAIVSDDECGKARELSWREMQRQAFSLAISLRELGVVRGDRVVAYLPNTPEAVIAFLACSSIGGVWSICAPDMGLQAITDRFVQIEPKVLIAVDGVHYAGKPIDRSGFLAQLQRALPSLLATVVLESAWSKTRVAADSTFAQAISRRGAAVDAFEPEWLPFDHPLWVLYTSGTTGLPKPIVQGQGGVLLTALATGLHLDLGASYSEANRGERFHWFTSTGWVMWNFQIAGLLAGTTICVYDGSPSGAKDKPDWSTLWRFAARHSVTFFGAGAAFYSNCMKAAVELQSHGDLSAVRALGTTGSPLPEEVQIWGTHQLAHLGKPDVWWYNVSGGTDLCGAFCTGHRDLPLIPGRMQCLQLGSAVEAWNEAGQPVIDEVGELVCTRPIPGMPLYFWGDAGNQRYQSSYFDRYPNVWRHGDWIKILPDGGCIIYGRSDATINRHGIRMGTSEIYAAVESLAQVLDSLVLDLEYLGKPSRLLLFVVLRPGIVLDEAIKASINAAIRHNLSPRFCPDEMYQAPEIPRTLTGKKQEVPMKKLFLGQPPDKLLNRDAMLNPDCVAWYIARAGEEQARHG